MGLLTEFEKIANARHHGGSQQGGLMTSGIEWSNNDGAKVSHCGNYRINATGWDRGRKSIYQLRVKLVDGWHTHPETFTRQKDAKAEAVRMEEG
tara:strand:- start:345 stop:626 length:282 start_codon:yes stop_codon:yes gene_type:complete